MVKVAHGFKHSAFKRGLRERGPQRSDTHVEKGEWEEDMVIFPETVTKLSQLDMSVEPEGQDTGFSKKGRIMPIDT